MSILNNIIEKIMSTPEIVNQIKNSLANRDLAIEIDGKRFQITKRTEDEDASKMKAEIWDLRRILHDIVQANEVGNLDVAKSLCKSAKLILKKLY